MDAVFVLITRRLQVHTGDKCKISVNRKSILLGVGSRSGVKLCKQTKLVFTLQSNDTTMGI